MGDLGFRVQGLGFKGLGFKGLGEFLRRTPHPVIVTLRENKDSYHIPIIPLLHSGESS